MFLASNYPGVVIPIHFVSKETLASYLDEVADTVTKSWLSNTGFEACPEEFCLVPDRDGSLTSVVCAVKNSADFWQYGAFAAKLPVGNYVIASGVATDLLFQVSLAWTLSCYKFSCYKKDSIAKIPQLKLADAVDQKSLQSFADSIYMVRDMINMPANGLGPEEMAQEVAKVANLYDAEFSQIVGDDLVSQNYPAIHAVGRASNRAPRLLEMVWGKQHAFKLAIVGKGVCFDSGGLDIKPAAGMRDMKKDMGGAAHALGLARMIMAHNLPVAVHLYIPAVDNVISGNAYMPGDIINTRAGISVEIDNTDAEGRLVLADALAKAAVAKPDLIIDFATLTGAARVALGPDLPAMFANDDAIAMAVSNAANKTNDPVWQMPLVEAYNKLLESKVADISNCANTGYGGTITAALFLQNFVTDCNWLHFDIMAANTRALPGRPEGGEAMSLRALFNYISTLVAQ